MSSEPSRTTLPRSEGPQPGSGAMFDRIAARYDLLNRLMTAGIDQRWRRRAVDSLQLPATARALDLATGTADMALQIVRRYPAALVTGLDPSSGMLEVGRQKVEAAHLSDRIKLEPGDAQALPFEDNAFDGVCMAFGIRNVPNRGQALTEMARVTRKGGRIAILELNEPRHGILGMFARFYIHQFIPRLGAFLSGAQEYRYLQESISRFPPPGEFADLMRRSGLKVLEQVPFAFGSTYLFVATPEKEA